MKLNAWILLPVLLAVSACASDESAKSNSPDTVGDRSSPPASGVSGGQSGGGLKPRSNYVGLQYDSLPVDFHYRGGAVIPRGTSGTAADYDFAYVATPSGEMVWLDTIGASVGKGLRAKIVRAELMLPPMAPDERLFMASCDAGGKLDPGVVAIVIKESGVTKFTKVRQAWRVNVPAARFDLLPLAGIVCEDPGS